MREMGSWLNRSCHTSTKKIMVFIANSIPTHIYSLSAFSQRQHERSQHQKPEPTKLMSLSVQAARITRSPSFTSACSHFWFLRRNAVARCRFWHPQAKPHTTPPRWTVPWDAPAHCGSRVVSQRVELVVVRSSVGVFSVALRLED